MRNIDVALVTSKKYGPPEDEERLLLPALAERGIRARHIAWDDATMDWLIPRMSVLRATWDYHHRLPEFLAWADHVATRQVLWNPLEAVRWNTHKTYLRDLELCGIAVVPTIWLSQGTSADLATLMKEHDWHSAVVKPAISASSSATMLVTTASLTVGQAHLTQYLATHDMLVQLFLASVATQRERSLIFIDGELTHAVLRRPSLGLSQPSEAEGELISADPEEVAFAQRALQLAGYPTLYARVDIIRDDTGALRLMELELVEPGLWLDLAPWSAQRFADAIARYDAKR